MKTSEYKTTMITRKKGKKTGSSGEHLFINGESTNIEFHLTLKLPVGHPRPSMYDIRTFEGKTLDDCWTKLLKTILHKQTPYQTPFVVQQIMESFDRLVNLEAQAYSRPSKFLKKLHRIYNAPCLTPNSEETETIRKILKESETDPQVESKVLYRWEKTDDIIVFEKDIIGFATSLE